MKTSGKYSNGQVVSEQKGDVLTYYHINGEIKAQGKCIDGLCQGKWIFNKKEGYLWNSGYFKDNKKHGKWTRYKNGHDINRMAALKKKRPSIMGRKLNSRNLYSPAIHTWLPR